MKRILFPIFIAIFATIVIADNRTMVIVKKDGNMHAIHNEEVDSIAFSQFDLPEKYYNLQNDTIINYVEVHDTIDNFVEVHDTLYVQNEVEVHDTIFVESVIRDTIYVTQTVEIHDTIRVEVPVIVYDTVYVDNSISGYENGYAYVDLGVKDAQGRTVYWASYNIGAQKPEETGLRFAWGETTGYKPDEHDFTWANYSLCYGSDDTLIKYCSDKEFGVADNKYVLEPEDDAATQNWGGSWRMPTYEEMELLIAYCDWTNTILNGVHGCMFYNRKDANKYIFIPCTDSYTLPFDGSTSYSGYYWSSTRDVYPCWACVLHLGETDRPSVYEGESGFPRAEGLSIRPVFSK